MAQRVVELDIHRKPTLFGGPSSESDTARVHVKSTFEILPGKGQTKASSDVLEVERAVLLFFIFRRRRRVNFGTVWDLSLGLQPPSFIG